MTPKNKSWIGQVLGDRYTIESLLGRGGMSSVYRAADKNLKRDVALKIIHPHLTKDPKFVQQFEQEATAVAQLRHQNIVRVYDIKREEGLYYIVMEYIPGETLAQKLAALQQAEMRLPLTEATRIAINLCDAVDYAHQRRMIHRDIKPANVMINLLGEPILMDFGIARLVGQPLTALDEQTALGTALYMSPEQALGNAVDYRADIYSLGALIYEMLDGRPPFPGDSIQHILDQQISAAVPDLFAANSNLPQTLITIVERALEKQPERRYQSAADMATALQTVAVNLQNPLETLGSRHLEHLGRLWLQANEAYDEGDYIRCIEKIDELTRTGADYQSGQAAQLRQDAAQQLYEQAVDFFQAGKFGEAAVVATAMRELTPHYPNLGHLYTQIRQSMQSNTIQSDLDALYETAVSMLEERRYEEALKNWETVEAKRGSLPYRDRMQVERRAKEGICAILYNNAFAAVSRQNPHEAMAYWNQIKAIDPDFQDEDGVLELAERLINTEDEIKHRDKRLLVIAVIVGVLLVLSQVVWVMVGRADQAEMERPATTTSEATTLAAVKAPTATKTRRSTATAVFTSATVTNNSKSDLSAFPTNTETAVSPTTTPTTTPSATAAGPATEPTPTTIAVSATVEAATTPMPAASLGTATPTNIGLALENSSLYDQPNLNGQELSVVAAGDPIVIMGRSEDSKWFFVGDGDVAGFVFEDRIQWYGEMGRLPIFTHSSAGGGSATPKPADQITPLSFDLWPLPETAVCTNTGWEMLIFFQGHGGDGIYAYFWNGEPVSDATPNSAIYTLVSPGGAVTGYGRVETGGSLWAQKTLFIEAPNCP